MGGAMLMLLGLGVFGFTSLMALGLLVARKITIARIAFASGLLLATLILATAALSFLQKQFHGDEHWPIIVLSALVLLLSGIGQFIAALRSPRSYGAALACAAAGLLLLAALLLGGDFAAGLIRVRDLSPVAVRFLQALSLFLALASLVIALFPK